MGIKTDATYVDEFKNTSIDYVLKDLSSSCDNCYKRKLYKGNKLPEALFVLRVLKNCVFSCADMEMARRFDFDIYIGLAEMGAQITEMLTSCDKCDGKRAYVSEFIESLKPAPV